MTSSISTWIDALQVFHKYKWSSVQNNIRFFHFLPKFEGCQEYQQELTEALKKVFCAQTQVPTDFLGKFYAEQFSKGLTKGLIEALPASDQKTKDKLAAFKWVIFLYFQSLIVNIPFSNFLSKGSGWNF